MHTIIVSRLFFGFFSPPGRLSSGDLIRIVSEAETCAITVAQSGVDPRNNSASGFGIILYVCHDDGYISLTTGYAGAGVM